LIAGGSVDLPSNLARIACSFDLGIQNFSLDQPFQLILKISKEALLSIQKISIAQIKAARALLGWSQQDLASHSGVSIPTVRRLEAEGGQLGGRATTGVLLISTLESAGVIFIDENGEGPGVRLRKEVRGPGA